MSEKLLAVQGAVCAPALHHRDRIVLGHGSGGRMAHELIQRVFLPAFTNPMLMQGDDAAVCQVELPHPAESARLAVTTDSHVVWPLFFPGGDIGRLAVCGTVNDLLMAGATPLYLTAGFILEEGLEVALLEQIVASMRIAAAEAGVVIVAGDTKVVQRGKADGVYINTAGVGLLSAHNGMRGAGVQVGDCILLSGSIGEHGMAVLQARGDLGFEAEICSDVAPLNELVESMLAACPDIHALRDPTRGGLATTLNEIARQSGVALVIEEQAIPIQAAVAAACEMLGFDPLYVANEGKLVAFVPESHAQQVMDAMHASRYGEQAAMIGKVQPSPAGIVLLKTNLGSTRILDMLSGEMLPRIC